MATVSKMSPSMVGTLTGTPEDDDGLRQNDYISLQNEEIRRLVKKPLIGAIAARLSQPPCGVQKQAE